MCNSNNLYHTYISIYVDNRDCWAERKQSLHRKDRMFQSVDLPQLGRSTDRNVLSFQSSDCCVLLNNPRYHHTSLSDELLSYQVYMYLCIHGWTLKCVSRRSPGCHDMQEWPEKWISSMSFSFCYIFMTFAIVGVRFRPFIHPHDTTTTAITTEGFECSFC